MVEPTFQYQFRLILIGDSTVGKSSLLKFFTDGIFNDRVDPTIGVDFFVRLIEVKPSVKVKLQMWDTAGQERFRSIARSYYRNSVGVFLCYDIANRSTFEHLPEWLQEAYDNIDTDNAVYMVVGHKCDLEHERQVAYAEGQMFADTHGMIFMETSAKTGQNVEDAFRTVSSKVYDFLGDGRFFVHEGWDGIKDGYMTPMDALPMSLERDAFQLEERRSAPSCCS